MSDVRVHRPLTERGRVGISRWSGAVYAVLFLSPFALTPVGPSAHRDSRQDYVGFYGEEHPGGRRGAVACLARSDGAALGG
jgi:hypothetical protein